MKQPELSVIIVSYNTLEYTRRSLESVFAGAKRDRISTEVIVIDNGSTDGSREMIRHEYPKAVTYFPKNNLGFGKANNYGIKKARGEYVLLLNSDAFVLEDALSRLLAFGRRNPRSFIGGKLFNMDGTPQPSCGPFYSLPVVFLMLFVKGDHFRITRYSPSDTRQVGWISGACIMAPQKLFLDGLLFDENIFMYMEEVDLFYRARQSGYRVLFFPQAKFIHVGSGSAVGGKKEPVLNIYRGLLYLYGKHRLGWRRVVLLGMLRLKAVIALIAGQLTGSSYLMTTYEEALTIS